MDFLSVFRYNWGIDTVLGKESIPLVKIACLLTCLTSLSFVLFALDDITSIFVYGQSEDKENENNNGEQGKNEDKQVYKLRVGYKTYPIKYSIKGGELVNMTIPRSDILEVFIKPNSSGSITVEIPKSMSLLKGNIFDFKDLRTITLDFDSKDTSVKVMGLTKVSNLVNLKESKDRQTQNKLAIAADENKTMINNSSSISNTNVSLSDLPQIIQLVDPGWGDYNLTLRAIINNGNITYQDNYKTGTATVYNWNPILLFQVPSVGPGMGLIDVGHVSMIPIKLYKDPEEMKKNIHIWKNIPLNEEVVFRIPNRGMNLIVAEVQFSNGVKGLYAGGLTIDVHESKSEGSKMFNEERSQDKKLITKEVKLSKSSVKPEDQDFFLAAQNISCIVHKKQGFDVCQ